MSPVAGLRKRPAGSAPPATVKVYGAVPPEAVIVCAYGCSVVPGGSVVGLRIMAGQPGLAMVIVYRRLPEQPVASVAVIVKVNVPTVVGVPVIAPVELLRSRFVGSAPLDIENVYGDVRSAATPDSR